MLGLWKTKKELEAEYKDKFKLIQEKFAQNPLSGENLNKYYVSFSNDMMKAFRAKLDLFDRPGKFLFTGQKGCGKTTELNQIAKDFSDKYVVILMSIREITDTRDPDYRDILLLMTLKLLERLIEFEKGDNFIPPINEIFKLVGAKPDEMLTDTVDKVYVFGQFKLLSHKMRTQSSARTEIREKANNNLFGITNFINLAAEALKIITGKKVLLIVDDLDKIDLDFGATKEKEIDKSLVIFRDNVQNLILPECHVIYTMPFSLYHRDEFILFRHAFDDWLILPSVTIYKKEEKEENGKKKITIKENDKQIEFFEKILTKRLNAVEYKKKKLEHYHVFEEEVMVDLIVRSGGLVGELMRIMWECCFALMQKGKPKIDTETLNKVCEKWQMENSRLLHSKEKSILRKVFDSKTYSVIPDDRLPLFLREVLVLEQREKEIWYDIHPLLRKVIGVDEEPDYVYKKK